VLGVVILAITSILKKQAALEKQNRYDEAVRALEVAASLDATYAEPHYSLGKLYQRQGEREKAKKAVERFQELKKPGS
jgi:tetratricopeptide (TPR) repeat protein